MKFENYILNERRTKKISEDEIINLINIKCKNNFKFLRKSSIKLYRGVNFFDDYGFVDSNKGSLRKSANTFNYMTLLMDNLPSWKNYPKRSKSIICSTDINYAKDYGNLFYVIPYDNTNIGIATSDDIWFSFKFFNTEIYEISSFNDFIHRLFKKNHIKVNDSDYKSFKNGLIKLNSLSDEIDYDSLSLFKKDRDIISYLDHIFSPAYNNFKRGIKNIKEKREVWIQGKSLLINVEKFNKINDILL